MQVLLYFAKYTSHATINHMQIQTSKTLIFFDTETTGNELKDRLCQLAYKTLNENISEMFDELYKPEVPITVASQAVHHITPRMVENKPAFTESPHYEEVKKLFEDTNTILVAHNAKFDIEMLAKEGITCTYSIDTLKIARYLDPDVKIERYNLQFLRYLLELDKDIDEKIQAHDAKGDVLILEKLFVRLFTKLKENENLNDEQTLTRMVDISRAPSLITKFTFGKHVGKKVADVALSDRGYLEWLLNTKRQSEQDEEDWIYTLEHFLNT